MIIFPLIALYFPYAPVTVPEYVVEYSTQSIVSVEIPEPKLSYPTPINKSGEWITASVSAYSCGGIRSEAERRMNCPNLRTATGTTPMPGRTVACGRGLIRKTIEIEGVGKRVCEDTGGRISSRHVDLYVGTIAEAKKWGRKKLRYRVIHK